MPTFNSIKDMSDYGRTIHALHSADFAYRIAAIREGRLVPKDRTLAAVMSLAHSLCPTLHEATSVVGYDQSPNSIKPPMAKSQKRVEQERRHLADYSKQEKAGFFASLFSLLTIPQTDIAPTSTTKRRKQ